jgi:hypothetical protein
MAAPPEDLRTHDRGSETPCECQKLEKAGGKLFTDQMVGVTAERRVPPGSVGSIRGGSAAASQVRKPYVADPGLVERGLQCRLLILRLTAGAGKAPNIRDYLNPIRRQDGKEVGEGARRMPHCPHSQGHV